jgi:hypothetical protein
VVGAAEITWALLIPLCLRYPGLEHRSGYRMLPRTVGLRCNIFLGCDISGYVRGGLDERCVGAGDKVFCVPDGQYPAPVPLYTPSADVSIHSAVIDLERCNSET